MQHLTLGESPCHLVKIRSPKQTLALQLTSHISIRQAMDYEALRVRAACGGNGMCGACLIQTLRGSFNAITLTERQKIPADELEQGMRLACQLTVYSDAELYLANPAPQSIWKSLPDGEFSTFDYPGLDLQQHVYGIAVDLGTTCIRLSLWHRGLGRCMGRRYTLNPQLSVGSDVLTRLASERQNSSGVTQGKLARDAIIAGVRDILSRDIGEITAIIKQIGEVLIVGNTAMLTLLCEDHDDALLDPENWQHTIQCQPADPRLWLSEWRMPAAMLTIIQPLAGFIGSDLLAGVIASALTEHSAPALLIDFGTNTEIALWDGHTLWITSVPGGPAFEGMGLKNGMLVEEGAIVKVTWEDASYRLQTIGAAPARGFCACGFVDAIAQLRQQGVIKLSGRFAQEIHEYSLDAHNPKTAITAYDIDLFQRAKGATAAAILEMLHLADLTMDAIQQLWICGNFGQHLDIKNAMYLGLVPPILPHQLYSLANASLIGAEHMLFNTERASAISKIIHCAEVINLTRITTYEERFIENLRLCAMGD